MIVIDMLVHNQAEDLAQRTVGKGVQSALGREYRFAQPLARRSVGLDASHFESPRTDHSAKRPDAGTKIDGLP